MTWHVAFLVELLARSGGLLFLLVGLACAVRVGLGLDERGEK